MKGKQWVATLTGSSGQRCRVFSKWNNLVDWVERNQEDDDKVSWKRWRPR
jgi:hypothetical protein